MSQPFSRIAARKSRGCAPGSTRKPQAVSLSMTKYPYVANTPRASRG